MKSIYSILLILLFCYKQVQADSPIITPNDFKIGSKVIVGYFQSAQGDVKVGYSAELSAVGANMYGVRTFEYAEKKGRIMTDAVLKLLPLIKTSGDMVVRATYDHFNFPRRTTYPYTHAEALRWQREAREKLAEKEKLLGIKIGPRTLDTYKVDLWLANQAVSNSQLIESTPPNPAPIRMPMQAIRLGNTVFVTFPCEVFTEIGLEVKKQSPYKNTFKAYPIEWIKRRKTIWIQN